MLAQHREVAEADNRDLDALIETSLSAPAPRGFASRLRQDSTNNLAVIAEIKRRSPSRGSLNSELDPTLIAQSYEEGGASCLSVLTDADFFGGSVSDLQQARSSVNLPVLRKDFTISRHDICDARIMGADCVLLIAAALSKSELTEFFKFSIELGLDALVEVHDETELTLAIDSGATLIGVNQRDLHTFQVDHQRAVRMAAMIPTNVVRVAESGVKTRDDARSLRDAGYDAVLVGESLVTSNNISNSVRELRV
ncbi:MAG: indole-3-glycerol phosphate synthase TrpC [Actinobacteria bacterium]|nr:indole-3-glycerol phosphate synthase TrpC [Actinomycetota bacterium]MTH90317.1 indole-3-glycerol phosphate synthase TrpC [Actinomycetota bacterium]